MFSLLTRQTVVKRASDNFFKASVFCSVVLSASVKSANLSWCLGCTNVKTHKPVCYIRGYVLPNEWSFTVILIWWLTRSKSPPILFLTWEDSVGIFFCNLWPICQTICSSISTCQIAKLNLMSTKCTNIFAVYSIQ